MGLAGMVFLRVPTNIFPPVNIGVPKTIYICMRQSNQVRQRPKLTIIIMFLWCEETKRGNLPNLYGSITNTRVHCILLLQIICHIRDASKNSLRSFSFVLIN